MSPRVAVVGYASLDHAMATGEFRGLAGTTLVRSRLSHPWPAPGGVAHLGRGLARSAVDTEVISWVGPDASGREYVDALRADGVGVAGIVTDGSRSPASYLLYPDDGGTVVIYDPGDCHGGGLAPTQAGVLSGVDWLVVAVGPRAGTEAALDAVPATARVAWAVKADYEAFPPALIRRLLETAAVVTFSSEERSFLDSAGSLDEVLPPDTLVVETRGAEGVRFVVGDREQFVPPVARMSGVDATGAGDTFAAALVAECASAGPGADPRVAVVAAMESVAAFLRTRAEGAGMGCR